MNVYVLMMREKYEEGESPISVFTNKEVIEDEILKLKALDLHQYYYYKTCELDPKPLETDMERGPVYEITVDIHTRKVVGKKVEEKYRNKNVKIQEIQHQITNEIAFIRVTSPVSYEHAMEHVEEQLLKYTLENKFNTEATDSMRSLYEQEEK